MPSIIELDTDFVIQEFRPVIFWEPALRVAVVATADATYVERQLTHEHFLAVFEMARHSRYGEEHFVGFSLWTVKGVCARMGIEPKGKISMRRILQYLHEHEENQSIKDAIEWIMLPMLEDHNLDEFEI